MPTGLEPRSTAIMSVFLGAHISDVLDKIEISTSEEAIVMHDKKILKLDIPHIPEALLDNTDRNRTSPFAFTGNRFELRGVGSSANCASSLIVLNSIVAAQLKEFKTEVDKKIANGLSKEQAIFEVIKSYIKISKPIRFDGNGYSEEWKAEALKRGLDCESSIPEIYKRYTSPESIEMFKTVGVLSEKELYARNEVKWDIYAKKIQIEARDICLNHIIPVSMKYQSLLLIMW